MATELLELEPAAALDTTPEAGSAVDLAEFVEAAVPEGFHITDEKSANWLLRKINEQRKRAADAEAWAASEAESAARVEKNLIQRFGDELETFAEEALEGKKVKSLKLPGGKMGFRKSNPKIKVEDADKLVAWAKKNLPKAVTVKTTETVAKSVVNDYWSNNKAVIPDGCKFLPEDEEFYID